MHTQSRGSRHHWAKHGGDDLDFGVQLAVAKFVAEFEARGDQLTAGHYATAGFAIMIVAGILGCCLSGMLTWQVPRLFHSMPASLYRDVRVSVLLVEFSFSLGRVCSVFSVVFLGLHTATTPCVLNSCRVTRVRENSYF